MGKLFPVREKSWNFEQTGKSQGILPKILKKMGQFYLKYWKSENILACFYFVLFFFSDFFIEVYLLKRFLYLLSSSNKTLKKYWKWKENNGKVREICQSENVGTMLLLLSRQMYTFILLTYNSNAHEV